MIKAIAIDDEPPALLVLEAFCGQVEGIEMVKAFSKSAEAIQFLQSNTVDLIFLDINMPAISGIDLYKQHLQKTMVIFTTAYSEFAVEGFNLSAIDYLLKPFTMARFVAAVNKVKEQIQYKNQALGIKQEHLFLRIDYSLVKIKIADILFIEGLDDYLKIHLSQQKPLVARMTLKALTEQLPATDFVRVHRSYIVPIGRIENVRNKIITIAGEEIPLGKSYEEGFVGMFKK